MNMVNFQRIIIFIIQYFTLPANEVQKNFFLLNCRKQQVNKVHLDKLLAGMYLFQFDVDPHEVS